MLKNGYKIGGEQSGHIIFTDFSTTGDGLITALQVLSSLKRSGRKASDLTALMTTYPQLLVNVKVATKEGWEDNEAIKEAIAAGDKELGENGRILVRPSGTEPLIRVMAEGPDQEQLDRICHAIADVVKKEQADEARTAARELRRTRGNFTRAFACCPGRGFPSGVSCVDGARGLHVALPQSKAGRTWRAGRFPARST